MPAAAARTAVQLAVHTPWSFHFGASPVPDLALRAAERGITALAMTDTNGLWGAVPFQQACVERGVRPLIGCRLRVEGAEARVLALDAAGYAGICRLSSRVQLGGLEESAPAGGASTRLLDWIGEEGGGFAVLSEDVDWLRALREKRGPEELHFAARAHPTGWQALEAAAAAGFPAVAATPVVFADRTDWERHRLLTAIGRNASVKQLEGEAASGESPFAPRDAWLHGADALHATWQHAPEVLRNADALAERCAFRIPLGVNRQPKYPTPGGRSAAAHLARLCDRGWKRRRLPSDGIVENVPGRRVPVERYRAQLRRELAMIHQQGFDDYFLVVADIARWAREHGIQSCGRGSAANSLVSHLLGLTHVDPLAHDLYFERFLHEGRSDYPDVDLDFAWDERDDVLDYVYRKYGTDRVAMICTHQTFAARGAVRELAKAVGLPAAEIGPVTRALPYHGGNGLDPEALRSNPKMRGIPFDAEPWATILDQAQRLDGFPRHLGVHSGGIVLAPTPLTDHLPLTHAAKETEQGRVVITQWDMYPVEDAGLVKIDLLGNRGLAVIRDSVESVRENTGLRIDFARVDPQKDSRTCRILVEGDTMGCFYVESPSMRSLLQKLTCGTFPTLVAASSIIRPGIAQSGMMQAYIERHHWAAARDGEHDPSWYLHPAMRELLAETYGVMAYQEDVLKVAQAVSGMPPAQGDGMRRAMSKKRAYHHLENYRRQFVGGAVERGTPQETAEELWRQIESFSGYSFCKAHSASFAEVSFRSAYLRAHHPAEFMASVLANYGGYYSTFAYLAEARRMGLALKLPGVNTATASFRGDNGAVQVGLLQIRGLSLPTISRLLDDRDSHGAFADQDDLLRRLRLRPLELEALVRAGALDELPDGMTRPERMRSAALYARRHADPITAEGSLFTAALDATAAASASPSGAPDDFVSRIPKPPPAPEYDRRQLLRMEWEALDFLVSAHPLALYADPIRNAGAVPARDLRQHLGKRIPLIGWQVTQKPVRTKKGDPMLFLSFEDTTALYETVLFPDAYRRLAPWTLTRGPYLLEGTPKDEYGVITVDVHHLELLDPTEVADRRSPSHRNKTRA